MLFAPNSYELDDKCYRLLTDLLYRHSGLRFEESVRNILQKRLSARIRELNLDSFEKYYFYLMYHPNREAEMEAVFNLITTNETYFFREESQLRAFSEEIVPQMIQEKGDSRTLRIWSAGCSTGEEAYSVAILCKQMEHLRDWEIDIFASDISQKAIQTARRGNYGNSSFRCTQDGIREKFFDPTERSYKIKDEIRNMVTFGKLNLVDEQKTGIFAELDLIFCRNVLMYFDAEAKKKVIETFYRKLRKNGYLLLGHSESLLSLSTKFKLVHLKNDMVYQK